MAKALKRCYCLMMAQNSGSKKTDTAALAAAVVAVVLSQNLVEGPYNLFGIQASAAITLTLLAYAGEDARNWFSSVAFGSVLAVALVPVTGFIMECYSAQESIYTLVVNPKCVNNNSSRVNPIYHFEVWSAVAFTAAVVDICFQQFRGRQG